MRQLTPYTIGHHGDNPQDYSVGLQVDLTALETLIVEFISKVVVNEKSPLAHFLTDHLHAMVFMRKVEFFGQLVKEYGNIHPDCGAKAAFETFKGKAKKMAIRRNQLSHCLNARIDGCDMVISHKPKGGATETRVPLAEYEAFQGANLLDLADGLKHVYSFMK